jgi:hypothetical protein
MRVVSVIVVAAGTSCWTAMPEPQPPHAPAANNELVITDASFGPLDASSPATLAYLRAHFADLEIRPVNDPNLEYRAFAGSDELFFVVTNGDFSIFNVHATSPKVTSRVHDWRVGSAFHDARLLTGCECWGDTPTCFHRGEHVAVSFERSCNGLTGVMQPELGVLDGLAPQRVIWSPTAFGGSGEIDGVDDLKSNGIGDDDDDGF